MTKVSGRDLISSATEKSVSRLILFASAAILAKAYEVPLDNLELLKVKIPAALFDTALIVIIAYLAYSLVINWVGDLGAYRLWYSENSLWSMFGTRMKIDRDFLSGGVPLLLKLHELEAAGRMPASSAEMDEATKNELTAFKTNVELYAVRLEHAGRKFSALSWFAHYYVWFQNFLFPIGLSAIALYLLVKYGHVALPAHV